LYDVFSRSQACRVSEVPLYRIVVPHMLQYLFVHRMLQFLFALIILGKLLEMRTEIFSSGFMLTSPDEAGSPINNLKLKDKLKLSLIIATVISALKIVSQLFFRESNPAFIL